MYLDWGTVPDWVGVGISAATLGAAVYALLSWRAQLRGTKRHDTAHTIAQAARALRYAFYEARSPFISAWEFPDSYRNRRAGEQVTPSTQADEYAYAYGTRLKELWPYIRRCAELRADAGAVFGDDVALALEELAKKAREYEFVVQEYVEQTRSGPAVVRQWTDQAWVKRIQATIGATVGSNDPLSTEFEELLRKLIEMLKDDLDLV